MPQNALRRAREKAATTAEAARVAAETLFRGEPLSGVGSAVWRQLWEAAKRYSEAQAYTGRIYPVTAPDTRCVLCQQPLSEDASARMKRFEEFIRADTQKAAQTAATAYEFLLTQIRTAAPSPRTTAPLLKELETHDQAAFDEVRRFVANAWIRRRSLLKACCTGEFDAIQEPRPVPESIERTLASLSARIKELEESSKDEGRKRLIAEMQELKDRGWLSLVVEDIKKEIERQNSLATLAKCLRDTETTAISTKGGALADAVVTNALRDRFAGEIQALNLRSVRVELNPAGSRQGAKLYQIRFVGSPKLGIEKVVSEGEHRCLALAAFLAELATTSDRSTLILDDPVSSLDHVHRDDVAGRLVKEAKNRQVIVFTHDIVFLYELARQSKGRGLGEPFYQYVSRSDTYAGYCGADVPLRSKPVSESIAHIKKRATQIAEMYGSGQTAKYEEQAGMLYRDLRIMWEAGVAEVLQPVIERFKRDVKTRNLLKLTVITADDCRLANVQRARCSEFQHDGGEASNQPPPAPKDLLNDIGILSEWFEDLRTRQDGIRFSADEVVEPELAAAMK